MEVYATKNSGVEAVHGNLFKLNPAMTKYIDQLMAKRIAQEKAKMFRDLKRRGLVSTATTVEDIGPDESNEISLPGGSYTELESLRCRVKELEDMEATNKKWGVGISKEDSFEELASLRKRVSDLEAEKEEVQYEMAKRMKDAESSLLEEMQELRIKVCELQKIRALTHSECSELYALREKMTELAGRKTRNTFKQAYKTWHPSTYMSNCDMMLQDPPPREFRQSKFNMALNPSRDPFDSESTTEEDSNSCQTMEEQARVVGQLEGLRDRLRELHDVAVGKLTQDNFLELASIREKVKRFQAGQMAEQSDRRKSDGSVLNELEEMRRKLREFQSIPVEHMEADHLRELASIKDRIVSLQVDVLFVSGIKDGV